MVAIGFIILIMLPLHSMAQEMLLAATSTDKKGLEENNTKDLMKSVMGSVLPLGISEENLPNPKSPGAQLLIKHCTQCHELPGPGLHSANDWPKVFERMRKRTHQLSQKERVMMAIEPMSDTDAKTILTYLQKHGYKTMDQRNYPDLDTKIGKAFRTTCAQCHTLPEPSTHTQEEWREVVLRMRDIMKQLGVADPGDAEIAKVIGYLQRHAKN